MTGVQTCALPIYQLGGSQEGGMVEIDLSEDIIPKITINFKAKKVLDQFKPKEDADAKAPQ